MKGSRELLVVPLLQLPRLLFTVSAMLVPFRSCSTLMLGSPEGLGQFPPVWRKYLLIVPLFTTILLSELEESPPPSKFTSQT